MLYKYKLQPIRLYILKFLHSIHLNMKYFLTSYTIFTKEWKNLNIFCIFFELTILLTSKCLLRFYYFLKQKYSICDIISHSSRQNYAVLLGRLWLKTRNETKFLSSRKFSNYKKDTEKENSQKL